MFNNLTKKTMDKKQQQVSYEAPRIDLLSVDIEAGFALSSGNPEDWKDSGNNWEQD